MQRIAKKAQPEIAIHRTRTKLCAGGGGGGTQRDIPNLPVVQPTAIGREGAWQPSHLPDATFDESMAGNGFDYFEVWSHTFDFGTPEMTTF